MKCKSTTFLCSRYQTYGLETSFPASKFLLIWLIMRQIPKPYISISVSLRYLCPTFETTWPTVYKISSPIRRALVNRTSNKIPSILRTGHTRYSRNIKQQWGSSPSPSKPAMHALVDRVGFKVRVIQIRYHNSWKCNGGKAGIFTYATYTFNGQLIYICILRALSIQIENRYVERKLTTA